MKNERIKKLEAELKYLLDDERKKEIENYNSMLDTNKVNIKEVAKEIYHKRGINYDKLNKGFLNNLTNTINELSTTFKNKDSATKRKMIIEIIYIVILLILIKVPFDLVRDIGYDYIELLSTNNLYYTLWNLIFLLLYTGTIICTFIVLIKNFNNKYKN